MKDHRYTLDDKDHFLELAQTKLAQFEGVVEQTDVIDGYIIVREARTILHLQRLIKNAYKDNLIDEADSKSAAVGYISKLKQKFLLLLGQKP